MAAVDEIAIKLGIKTGDLKAALADAGAAVKKFKKDGQEDDKNSLAKQFSRAKEGLEKFRSVLAGAGLVAIFRQLTDAANKFAEDYTGAYDEAVGATLRLKQSQDDLGGTVSKIVGRIGVELVGAMDKFGTAVGALVYGTDAASTALLQLEEANKKAFDDAKLKKFREEEEKLAKVTRENALQSLSDNDKINMLAGEFVKLLQEQAKLKKDSIEYVKKQIEVETKRGELNKQEAETRKREEDDRKKAAEELAREEKSMNDDRARNYAKLGELFDKERESRRESLTLGQQQKDLLAEEVDLQNELADLEEGSAEYNEIYGRLLENRAKFRKTEAEAGKTNLEIAKLLLIPEEKRTEIQKEQLRILMGETTEHEQQLELQRLLNIGVENLTAAERNRLAVLTGQTAQLEEQDAISKMLLDREAQIQKARSGTVKQTGDVRNLSDVQLDQLIQDLNKKISLQKAAFPNDQKAGGRKPFEQVLYEQNLTAAQKERDLRSSFNQTSSFFGQDYAERQYAPDDFSRLSQLMNPDQAKKDSNNLAVVTSGLQTLFPDKFTGAQR